MGRAFSGRWPVTNSDQIRVYLATRDVPCPNCRHCLRGIRDPRCPECGTELDVLTLHARRGRFVPAVGLEHVPGLLIVLNVGLALAVLVSATAHKGALPKLAWLAPAVIGAFACSLAYWPVLLKYQASTVEDPPEVTPLAWMIALLQTGGLILLWV